KGRPHSPLPERQQWRRRLIVHREYSSGLSECEGHLYRIVLDNVPDALRQHERKHLACEDAERYDGRENRYLRERIQPGLSWSALPSRWSARRRKAASSVELTEYFSTAPNARSADVLFVASATASGHSASIQQLALRLAATRSLPP